MVLSKVWGYAAIVTAVFGALNTADVLAVIGPQVGSVVTVIATVLAAISRALTDRDGDGKPDLVP